MTTGAHGGPSAEPSLRGVRTLTRRVAGRVRASAPAALRDSAGLTGKCRARSAGAHAGSAAKVCLPGRRGSPVGSRAHGGGESVLMRRRMSSVAARALALSVVGALALGANACAARREGPAGAAGAVASAATAVAVGASGAGLVQVIALTLAEILAMRRSLASAEDVAAARLAESTVVAARADAARRQSGGARSAAAVRATSPADAAAGRAAEADAALAALQAQAASRLGLTGVPDADLADAIDARLAELEAELAAREAAR